MCETGKLGYQEIADILRTQIRNGDYPPGATLPKQVEIAEDFGVNVNTVGLAVDQLQTEGLVVQQRSHGTRVLDPNPPRLRIVRHPQGKPCFRPFNAACTELGVKGEAEVVSVEHLPADEIVAAALRVTPGTEVVRRLNQMRIVAPAANARIVQVQATWLPLRIAQGTPLDEPGKTEGGVHLALTELGYIARHAEEVVSARRASKEEATELRVQVGSPLLDVRRTSFTAHGEPIAHVHLVVTEHASLVYPQQL